MQLSAEEAAAWRAEGGPGLWRASLDRDIGLVMQAGVDHDLLRDGAAALAMAFYLIASEDGVRAEDVGRARGPGRSGMSWRCGRSGWPGWATTRATRPIR